MFRVVSTRFPHSTAGILAAGAGVGLAGGLAEAFPDALNGLVAFAVAQGAVWATADVLTYGGASVVAALAFPVASWAFKKFPAIEAVVADAEKAVLDAIPEVSPPGNPDIKPDNQTMRGNVQKPVIPINKTKG